MGAWAYQGLPQSFEYPPIIAGTGKATNFQFCTHIPSINRNKKPITNFGKNSRLLVKTLENFQGTHILGASRGHLSERDSYRTMH